MEQKGFFHGVSDDSRIVMIVCVMCLCFNVASGL